MTEVSKKPVAWFKLVGVLGVQYATKSAITEAVRNVINPLPPGMKMSGDDLDFMLAVLSHHPEWSEKCGSGVASVEVRMNIGAHFANKGLWLLRTDGSEVDISWRCAIDAAPPTYDKLVRDAARHAIFDQVQHVRDSANLRSRCHICDLPLDGETHVDHALITFEQLFSAWHKDKREFRLLDTGLHPVFADEVTRADWQEFHRLFSDLRLVHKRCNLSTKGATQ